MGQSGHHQSPHPQLAVALARTRHNRPTTTRMTPTLPAKAERSERASGGSSNSTRPTWPLSSLIDCRSNQRVDEVQSLGVGQRRLRLRSQTADRPLSPRAMSHPAQCRTRLGLHSRNACMRTPRRGKITLHEVGEIAIEIGKSVREVLSEALEHSSARSRRTATQ